MEESTHKLSGKMIRNLLRKDVRRVGQAVIDRAIDSMGTGERYTERYLKEPTRSEHIRGLLRDAVDYFIDHEVDDEN